MDSDRPRRVLAACVISARQYSSAGLCSSGRAAHAQRDHHAGAIWLGLMKTRMRGPPPIGIPLKRRGRQK